MLVNAVQSGTGTKAQIDGVTVGGKTGTVQNATGVLFAGITPDFTATLWVGSEKYKPQIQADIAFANSLPTENGEPAVGGTPTFFINGTRLVGAYPLSTFQQIIDAQLAANP